MQNKMQHAKTQDNDNVPVNGILTAVACTLFYTSSVNKGAKS